MVLIAGEREGLAVGLLEGGDDADGDAGSDGFHDAGGLGPDELARYRERARLPAPSGLLAWLHR